MNDVDDDDDHDDDDGDDERCLDCFTLYKLGTAEVWAPKVLSLNYWFT